MFWGTNWARPGTSACMHARVCTAMCGVSVPTCASERDMVLASVVLVCYGGGRMAQHHRAIDLHAVLCCVQYSAQHSAQ